MFQARLAECAGRVADCLDTALREFDDQPLAAAMRHAVRGGKRFRAFLVMESARLHWVDDANSVWAAAAVEAVHAYSLVHDDLPCMDDDDLRRGQPTVHVKWDEVTAVLAGDALQAWAFGLLSREELSADPQVRLALVASMARAAGPRGMVLGQAQDIAGERGGGAEFGTDHRHAGQQDWRADCLVGAGGRGVGGGRGNCDAALCRCVGSGVSDCRRHSGCAGRRRSGGQAGGQGCPGRKGDIRVIAWAGRGESAGARVGKRGGKRAGAIR